MGGRLLRAIPAPMAGQLTGMAALGFCAVVLIVEMPLVGHVQLPAALALTLPPPLSRILGFHGGRSSTKTARFKRSKGSGRRTERRRKKSSYSKCFEEDPEEETSISKPVRLCHLQNGGGNRSRDCGFSTPPVVEEDALPYFSSEDGCDWTLLSSFWVWSGAGFRLCEERPINRMKGRDGCGATWRGGVGRACGCRLQGVGEWSAVLAWCRTEWLDWRSSRPVG